MQNNNTKNIVTTVILFVVFILFTVAVCKVDVAAIGPQGSSVGFAKLNGAIAKLFPFNEKFYKITNYLGYFALLICVFFAAIGVLELVQRKSFKKIDPRLIMLGIFYVAVIVFYVMFI